ncbi:tRNA (adenosine(37)-N6)-dimethylallyltransferase MiaA, partial [Rickettsiales bacterium]|nr:tRNA (adenosine(37)-N6)-dimethylallyltransferase MiaA [Rickettsiales bacterium]
KHHMYQFIDPNDTFSIFKWLECVSKTIHEVMSRGKTPIILGGTPMYCRALIDGISIIPDPTPNAIKETSLMIDEKGTEGAYQYLIENKIIKEGDIKPTDTYRIERALKIFFTTGKSIKKAQEVKKYFLTPNIKVVKICIKPPRDVVYENCNQRFKQIIEEDGALDEVSALMKKNINNNTPIMKAIGVREIQDYLLGNTSLEECIELASKHTRNYAKRQYTWFNNNFKDFHIVESPSLSKILEIVRE